MGLRYKKVLIILVELTYRYIFALKFTLSSQQPDIVPIICHRFHWHRWQICHMCCWYCGKLLVLVPVSVVQIETSFEGHPSRGWAHRGGGHCHEWILALSSQEIRSRTTLSLTAAAAVLYFWAGRAPFFFLELLYPLILSSDSVCFGTACVRLFFEHFQSSVFKQPECPYFLALERRALI